MLFNASGSYTLLMAHFAKLGVGNIVERVVVVSNDIATTEQAGMDFLNNLYKTEMFGNKLLIRLFCSWTGGTPFSKPYANKGYTYDFKIIDAFIPPKPLHLGH